MPDNSTGSRKRKRGASKRRVGFGFNAKSREAQRWAKEFVGERITTINTETKLAVRKIVVDSIREGIPPRDAAKQIREMVGLNRPQGLALRRYVQKLSPSLSPAAKAKAGIKLKNKMIRRRAITIARTEVIDSLSGGVEQAWVQAQQKGLLGSNAKKEWVTTPFGACAICRALNGQSVKITGMFSSEIGPLARPTAHPNCRCGIAPVPGVGGMMQPAGLPPTVTPSMAAALTSEGLLIHGSDARKAILKYADSDAGLKQQQLIDAAEKQLQERGRALETDLFSLNVDAKVLNKIYKSDADEIFVAIRRAQRAGDDVEIKRLEEVFRKREALYTRKFSDVKTKTKTLEKELVTLQKAVDDAVGVQADEILETFVYNKSKNEMVDTHTAVKLTRADKAELDTGVEAFTRMVDDSIYTTTVEGLRGGGSIVSQETKVNIEFIKSLGGRYKGRTRGSRAFAHSDRDRAYRVKLNFKERSRRGRGTTVHELTHTVEFAEPGVLAEAIRWRDDLTQGDTLEWLGKLTNNAKYGTDEVAYGDGAAFKEKYIGKVYTEGRDLNNVQRLNYSNQTYTARDGWQASTEVSTMGMQAMYQNPVSFAREMPELFDFVYERIIRRKYTGATSKYALRVGDDFKLINTPSELTPTGVSVVGTYRGQALKNVTAQYNLRSRLEGLPIAGRPGAFALRLYELK